MSIKNLDTKVKGVLSELDIDQKREYLRTVLETVVVENANKVHVKGYIPAREEVQNVQFQPIYRDSWDINEHFVANRIPFKLKFRLPKLRKERIIFGRDVAGRIVRSEFQPGDCADN